MLSGAEPFASWYYLFAWYGVLVAGDGVAALLGVTGRKGEFYLLGRPGHLLSLMGWSAVIWFFYELLNFRLRNWYYVMLPDALPLRWAGTVLAFATVLPVLFLAEALLRGLGVARETRWPTFAVTDRLLRILRLAGAAMIVLVLVGPRWFFPLVWGATTLLVEPMVYRRGADRSLLGELAAGRPGRLLRLLLGGAAIGLLWELFNVRARSKWIYTVPWFDELKLFEMPVLGFLGFPPFAVECYVLWQALVVLGLAMPREGDAALATWRLRMAAATGAIVLTLGVLQGMDRYTVASLAPRTEDLPGVPAALAEAGLGPFSLASTDPADLAAQLGVDAGAAAAWRESARLAVLRGIGARDARLLHIVGIETVDALAEAEAAELARRLREAGGTHVVPERVREWVRAARAERGR
jgi:predicted flap endonuclease-1-like 5' DNA nuclease